jgi:mannitol-1-phosphate/altronate dehydrogenase
VKEMKKILIFGAGAIGRGFIAPVFSEQNFIIDFVETDESIIRKMLNRKRYITAIAKPSGYSFKEVNYRNIINYEDLKDISQYDAIFTAIGPRNCLNLSESLREAKLVFILENDIGIHGILKKETGNQNIYFGIPDVITSNTAPVELLAKDPLCVVSEVGKLCLQSGDYDFDNLNAVNIYDAKEFAEQWFCKFYIHNAPHAVVSFSGALRNYQFVHQAMADDRIGPIVSKAMGIITKAIIKNDMVREEVGNEYYENEIKRFSNPLLFDPINRVARDPFRKLDHNDRLVKSLMLVLKSGLDPYPLLLGISAAMEYRGDTVDDIKFSKYRRLHNPEEILKQVCNITDEKLIKKIIETDPYEELERK